MSDKASGMRHIRRWCALAILAWSVHVPAFSAQAEMPPCGETMQSLQKDDCQACATCIPAPTSAERTVERDDSPAVPAASSRALFVEPAAIDESTFGTAVLASVPLRVQYCRWLN